MYIRYLNLPSTITLKDIPYLWEHNIILILLIDLNSYSAFNTAFLDETEKKNLDKLKTTYFKKRFIISRLVIKYVLNCLLKEESVYGISTYKDEYGKVHVRDHEELHISVSYTENICSLAISKVNIGIDIELRKLLSPGKFSKYLSKRALKTDNFENNLDLLTLFTLKEAYSKFSNKNILSCLNKDIDPSNAFSSTYVLNQKYVLSVITDEEPHAISISFLEKIEFHEPSQD
jgi:4'-phosphopantetheinyl transferase